MFPDMFFLGPTACPPSVFTVNKHKPWLEPTYHGIVTENDNAVLLDPPLIALDKDAPLRYSGRCCCLGRGVACGGGVAC